MLLYFGMGIDRRYGRQAFSEWSFCKKNKVIFVICKILQIGKYFLSGKSGKHIMKFA